jgi:hypothetical protein
MTDKQIADTVRHLVSHIQGKEKEETGAAATACTLILARACKESNIGELSITVTDVTFGEPNETPSHYKIVVKKLKRKPSKTTNQ